MLRRVAAALLCLLICGCVTSAAWQLARAAEAASTITVAGNRHIDADMIRAHFHAAADGTFDAAALDAAVKSLYGTGLFEDVKIAREGARILVTVAENPTIGRLAFEGNKKIKDEDLKKAVQSKAGGPLSRALVHDDVIHIIELYRLHGYFGVEVDPKTIAGRDGRSNLVFEIKEGDKLAVRRVAFAGNSAYPSNKLKGVVKSGETNVLSLLLNNDTYDAERIDTDRDLLRRFYRAHGYADVRVRSDARYDAGTKGVVVTFAIDEGPQYRFGQVDIVSNVKSVDPAALRSVSAYPSRRDLRCRSGRQDCRGPGACARQERLALRGCAAAQRTAAGAAPDQSRLHDRRRQARLRRTDRHPRQHQDSRRGDPARIRFGRGRRL